MLSVSPGSGKELDRQKESPVFPHFLHPRFGWKGTENSLFHLHSSTIGWIGFGASRVNKYG